MNLLLDRFNSDEESTSGILSEVHNQKYNEFLGFTLEDEHRVYKVSGETRIPAKIYQIKIRNEGGLTKKYAQMYPDIYLWVRTIPKHHIDPSLMGGRIFPNC
jgi:hypothetical protein